VKGRIVFHGVGWAAAMELESCISPEHFRPEESRKGSGSGSARVRTDSVARQEGQHVNEGHQKIRRVHL